jgi:branched-chain amino acid transport system permease protein
MKRGLLSRLARDHEVNVALAVTAVALLLMAGLDIFQMVQATLWAIYGLLALSLNLVWGRAGIFSFGQTAFFGLAGYLYGIIGINLGAVTGETTTAILGAVAFAALLAALLGYFMFYGRVSDVYVGIITLAVTLVCSIFFASTAGPEYAVGEARLGGYNGMTGVPAIALGIPGWFAFPLDVPGTYALAVMLALASYLGLVAMQRSAFGRVLAAVRENEERTELLGYDTRRYKLIAFLLGGALAGLAGTLYAAWGLFINPAVFSLVQAALVVIWVLVGGRGVLIGSFLGVALVEGLSVVLGEITAHTPLMLGVLLVVIVLALPNGLIPSLLVLWGRAAGRVGEAAESVPGGAVLSAGRMSLLRDQADPGAGPVAAAHPSLAVSALGKSFDGLKALHDVTLEFGNRLQCIIGPNGAGKSTLFKLLVGIHRPTAGRIFYRGRDITRLEPHARARMGIGIKMQTASIYAALSVRENIWLAARVSKSARATADRRVEDVLRATGLEGKASLLAGHLSHGEKQWLEIGMVLASHPDLILLDEPTAGMTWEETSVTAGLVKRLAGEAMVIVVEHDMEFVRQLSAPVAVFHEGRVFKIGSLEDIRRDEGVQNIYLGKRALAGS